MIDEILVCISAPTNLYTFLCFLNTNIKFIVSPLFVIEFLHRVVDIFVEYFGDCSELRIKEHYVIVYEVSFMYYLG